MAALGSNQFVSSPQVRQGNNSEAPTLIDPARIRYLAEIADTVRAYQKETERLAERAADASGIARALADLGNAASPEVERTLRERYEVALADLDADLRRELTDWPETRARYEANEQSYTVRGKEIRIVNHSETLSHSKVPKVALPKARAWGELTRYLRAENLPGRFPFTAGVFPFKREGEDPVRMFAGEGPPERTNRRFHYLAKGQAAVRLSTAFDSVTLYGRDRSPPRHLWQGGELVSICTVDDAKNCIQALIFALRRLQYP
jgi:methylmalonyl-CoA mutase